MHNYVALQHMNYRSVLLKADDIELTSQWATHFSLSTYIDFFVIWNTTDDNLMCDKGYSRNLNGELGFQINEELILRNVAYSNRN